jgi:hypothetical protein
MTNETRSDRQQLMKPQVVRIGRVSTALVMGLLLVLAIEAVFAPLDLGAALGNGWLVAYLALLGAGAVYVWLRGVTTVAFDSTGLTVSTRYWRMLGRPPLHLPWSAGISATSSGVFWHRSVTIGGIHIDPPDMFSHDALAWALRERRIPIAEVPSALKNLVGSVVLVGFFFACFSNRQIGLPVLLIAFTAALCLMIAHSFSVDRQWRQAASLGAPDRPVG